MGLLGQWGLVPFSKPVPPWDDTAGPAQARGNDNQLGKAITGHDADASLHTVTTATAGVTTSAVAIYTAITGIAYALISGNSGAGATFVDQVVWNGATNTKTVITSTTIDGSPAARTYTVASGVLKLQMASGTYAISVVPISLT